MAEPAAKITGDGHIAGTGQDPQFEGKHQHSHHAQPEHGHRNADVGKEGDHTVNGLAAVLGGNDAKQDTGDRSDDEGRDHHGQGGAQTGQDDVSDLRLIADRLAHGATEQTADPAEILDDDRTIETIKVAVIGDLLFGGGCTQIVGYGIARNHLNEGKDEQSDKQNGDAGLHHTLADHFGKVVRFHSSLHFLRNLSPPLKQIPAQLPAPESAEIRRNVFRS